VFALLLPRGITLRQMTRKTLKNTTTRFPMCQNISFEGAEILTGLQEVAAEARRSGRSAKGKKKKKKKRKKWREKSVEVAKKCEKWR